jgi:hypothetical protein
MAVRAGHAVRVDRRIVTFRVAVGGNKPAETREVPLPLKAVARC